MEPADDGALLKRIRNGDEEAFTVFLERHQHSLINYLTHLTRSRHRAEEIAQDAFVRLYENAWRCRDEQRLTPYLFRIATNAVVSEVRRERRWKRIVPTLTAIQPSSAPATDRQMLTEEIQRKVAAALEQLPVEFRAPLVLYEIEEWAYEAIARALGCRLGTVKSRIFRARRMMRAQLESWWIGGNDDGRRILRQLPRVEASPRFRSDVLRAIRARRRPRMVWRLLAATAMVLILVAGTYGATIRRHRQRIQEVRAQLPQLRSELHRVKAIANEVQPVAVFENGETRVIVDRRQSRQIYY